MGRKYASIHISTNKQARIISELKKYYNTDSLTASQMQKASQVFKNPEVQLLFERLTQLCSNKVTIIQSESFISIYDDNLTFESIEEKAMIFSCKFDNPIVYVSNFDDDVLIFGVFRSGSLVTNRNLGNGLPLYEIPYATIDVMKLCNELKINDIESIEDINSSEEIDYVENEICRILHMPLKMTNDDVQSGTGCYEEKFNKNGICIYKKL